MKRINLIIPVTFTLLTLLWFSAENFDKLTWSYFSIRSFVVQYSGILAISAMSIAMILALRLRPVERFTRGLDKSYRLHKWLGICCLVVATIHWFWAKGSKYMVSLGLLEKPGRSGNAIGSGLGNGPGNGAGAGLGDGAGRGTADLTTIEGMFTSLRHFAESVGEWGFYLLVALIIIALLKTIRYSSFLNTHKIMSVVYLLLVFHSIILIDFAYWQVPIGWVVAGLIAVGSWAAIYSLAGRIGSKNKVRGKIEAFHLYENNRVLDITINTQQAWQGHNPGQFAFVQFKGEEAHPFTIASVNNNSGRIRFQVKGIGDFTNNLNHNLKINDDVIVEGPYGYFNFKSTTERQIWVAGGIGIAAFTAQLQSLAENPRSKEVDLFYCTQCPDSEFIEHIKTLAKQANIKLHVIDTNVDGFLTAQHICDRVSRWEKSDIWFCGPSNFAKNLQNSFARLGLKANNFHNELFEMR
ncbi:ferric reductase-like transmembrane domain-containing protein [Psychromonas sp.]|uniref:ferredoxin reductase family protein n=1 Tax=Psychromonas sp. TaxID=1884585 RepID=UPI00356B2568